MSIRQYKNKHKGERCFILGNGPSLNDVDLSLLEGEITFGTNRIYLSDFTPTYYACVNPLVLLQFGSEINKSIGSKARFMSVNNAPMNISVTNGAILLDTTLREPMFSSPEGPIWEGHTVTYVCMQLAYYMGFSEVILLGVDHYYGEQRQPNMEIVATGPDENHFHPDYFSGGTRWHTPDLVMSELAFSLAKGAYEKAGRKIINATTRTALDVFEKMPFLPIMDDLFRVSAIVSAYKSEEYIDGLIADLINQTEAIEIVVVCQEESTEHKYVSEFHGIRNNVTIITTHDIPTVYRAWNLGIKAAAGKYITNANTDDRHHPRAYKIMADVLDARPELDVVYHDSFISWVPNQTYEQFIRENQGVRLEPGRFEDKPGIFSWANYSRGALAHGCFIGPHPMWRASLHQKHGYFLDNYKSAGDYEFWLRVAEDHNMFRIGTPLGVYHARLDGVELSDPVVAAEESYQAIQLHQAPEASITPAGEGLLRFAVDGRWTYVNGQELMDILTKEVA